MRSHKGKVKLDIVKLDAHLTKLARRITALQKEYADTLQLKGTLEEAVKEKV